MDALLIEKECSTVSMIALAFAIGCASEFCMFCSLLLIALRTFVRSAGRIASYISVRCSRGSSGRSSIAARASFEIR